MIGMTSVTFRNLSVGEIIALVAQSGLDGIEWGGDVHVPPGDVQTAAQTKEQTEKAGLAVLSYGSYYRLGCGHDFAAVMDSAIALGAPVIRIWAGEKGSADADDAYYQALAQELRSISMLAAEKGITVALEYHRNTLTDTGESALRLLTMAQSAKCYWQPNPDISMEDRLAEIQKILQYRSNVHIFAWGPGNVQYTLDTGADDWKQYFAALRRNDRPFDAIMEFVKDGDPAVFLQDARTLRELWDSCL